MGQHPLDFLPAVSLAAARSYVLGLHKHYCHPRQCEHGLSSNSFEPAAARMLTIFCFMIFEDLLLQAGKAFENIDARRRRKRCRVGLYGTGTPFFFNQLCT